ncbi:hypothetical protein [Streptococcus sp. NLN64]|uniref:hypothetical protein n=1 Tax=Streptococcus sp. NLN64 TaxID=2822799 RepID=UPI001FFD84AA|nr:hypothetical protein [Streptococcus sp. NLN64]
MLENTAFSAFLERFPEDVQLILREMIPSYQQGYLDYVYQTDKPEIQARRIKNLVKNFRMMDYTFVMSLPQELALEIVSDWQYPPGFTELLDPSQFELLDAEASEGREFGVIWNGRSLGHFRLDQTDKSVCFST